MLGALLVVIASGWSSQASSGYFYDGNALLRMCKGNKDFCTGFVAGVNDHQAWVESSTVTPWFCIPDNATLGQLADVVMKYLDDHPETRHKTAVSLVAIGLYDAFPCE